MLISLTAPPTFKAKVPIPIPGGEPVPVEFTFKHRTKDALAEFVKDAPDSKDIDVVMSVATGWDLDDAFTRENVETLLNNFHGAARSIVGGYMEELSFPSRGRKVRHD